MNRLTYNKLTQRKENNKRQTNMVKKREKE